MKNFIILLCGLLLISNLAKGQETCLSNEEEELYQLVMEYRKQLRLPSIPLSLSLTKVARMHSENLDRHFVYGKEGNCNMHSWFKDGKLNNCCYTSDHKNAKCMWDKPRELTNYPGSGYEIAYYFSGGAKAKESLDGWKSSRAHNEVITNKGIWKDVTWKAIGIGIFGNYAVIWFGKETDAMGKPGKCR